MNYENKWNEYEFEKALLVAENLQYEEYEKRIREIIDKLEL